MTITIALSATGRQWHTKDGFFGIVSMKRLTTSRKWIELCAVSWFSATLAVALGDVKLTEETADGRTVYRMENERVAVLIDPSRGGNVTS